MTCSLCALSVHALDGLQCDAAVVYVFEDVRPLRGLAGAVDWRLGGFLSRLFIDGSLGGREGERFLVPLRPHLPVTRLFGFGIGPAARFTTDAVAPLLDETLAVLAAANVHSVALMLPGRGEELYGIAAGKTIVKGLLARRPAVDELVIVDRFEDPGKELVELEQALSPPAGR